MRVYHFNSSLNGGAAIAARRLHEALLRQNTESYYYYGRGDSTVDDSYRKFDWDTGNRPFFDKVTDRINGQYWYRKNYQRHVERYLQNRPTQYELFSPARLRWNTPLKFVGQKPDIIHLHWVAGLFDFPSFFASIPPDIPVVWTLHDMNPFTGGCHYSWECLNYATNCGECPQLNLNRAPNDLSFETWQIKHNTFKNKPLHLVANSYWIEECAKKSRLFPEGTSWQTIHYGLDTALFQPRNRDACKQALSILPRTFTLCFGADSIVNRRKGLLELYSALKLLDTVPITVLFFGDGKIDRSQIPDNITIKPLGRLTSVELQALVYSAADLFVIPSLYEAFGQTALEAMACGTPVVGFDTGGIPDMIRSGVTGLLAKAGDSEELAKQLEWMIYHPVERLEMGQNARTLVERDFNSIRQTKKYLDLYLSVLDIQN